VQLPEAATAEVAQEMAMPEPTATPEPLPTPQKVVPQPPPLQAGELD
jgi:hypothetical protein